MSRGQTHASEAAETTGADSTQKHARASSLDITEDEMRELSARTVELATQYFARVSDLEIFPEGTAEEITRSFGDLEFPEEGAPLEQIIGECSRIFGASRHNSHPRMFGYVASPATAPGAFASLLTATLNQNVTSWRSTPSATIVERAVTGWLARLIGYEGESVGGLLTSGGSMANLNALFVAHRAKASELASAGDASRAGLWNAGAPMTLYVSDQVHLSIPKAADVLGLGREQVRVVGTDENFRMDVRALREKIVDDRKSGLRPFCVVASAGTVSTGAVDSLEEIARVAEEHALWFHVDGAYGALAASGEGKRALFAGIERADSVSLDPHKWLYAPLDCGCLLLKQPERARAAFNATAEDYIRVFEQSEDESFAFWDYGVELSRPFRALKVWMMLRYYGARRVADAIAEDCALAAYFGERVAASEDFELLAPVTLGICCFRYVPVEARRVMEAADDAARDELNRRLDALNTSLMHSVQRSGRAYISNALLRGRFALRASITNFRTTRRDVDYTLDVIRDAARGI